MKTSQAVFVSFALGLVGFSSYSLSDISAFVLLFQQPTYLLEKENTTLSSYTCDTSQDACKVNLDFTPSVPTDEPSTHYSCLIDFGFGVTGQESKCNPSTVEFPVGNWTVRLVVKKIADDSIVTEGSFMIIHPDGSIDPLRVTHTREWQSPSYLLLKEDTSLTEYTCNPEETECKINLKVTPLLDGTESSQLTCEITSDFEFVPTTEPCNPNTSVVPIGEHTATIKILDKESHVLQTSTVILKNIPEDTMIDATKVVTEITWQQPTYLLEREDTSRTSYTCDPEKTECKVNILVVPKLDGSESSKLSCHIFTDFGTEESDCNPDTFIIPNGVHTLTIETINAGDSSIISTRTIELQGLPVPTAGGSGGSGATPSLDLSSSEISVQSGLDESFVCKTELCQVNFLAIVPPGALCTWNFGTGTFETSDTDKKCNPGYVKFLSDTQVTLTVTDPNLTSNTITKDLLVYRLKNTKITTDSLRAHIDLQTKITANKRLTSSGIICTVGKTGTCSLNFSGASSTGAKKWYWDFGDGTTTDKENPASHNFILGKYRVRLLVSDGSDSHEALYEVEVVSDREQKEVCMECAGYRGKIEISAVLPNPPHADTVEWIELRNISQTPILLDACELSDESKSFQLSGTLGSGKTLRLRQAITGLILGNSKETLTITCGEIVIDTFSWDFPIPTSYILRREVLNGIPEQAMISHVIDGDTVDAVIRGVTTRLRLLGIDTPETVHPRKSVEKFGKEASDFTRKTLEGKTVWLTFDVEPVDHYGRRLSYVWQCQGEFSESACTLFNAQIVSRGYGRMERRFGFRFYENFIDFEQKAKNEKLGIWSDEEVTKSMNELAREEKDILSAEQEREYLELQEELLKECLEEEIEGCEDEKISWDAITEKISTLSVNYKKSGIMDISGRTWGDFSVRVDILLEGEIIETIHTQSDTLGAYETSWIPERTGVYTIRSIFTNGEMKAQKEKQIPVEYISSHFDSPLSAKIILQGQITDNRVIHGDTFHCRSRGSCSLNVTAETNRAGDVSYFWIFPDGSVLDEKNPKSLSLQYGKYTIVLVVFDEITGEIQSASLDINHQPIPKKAKKAAGAAKYTLDIKDVPEDRGGGVVLEENNPVKNLLRDLVMLMFMSSGIFLILKK